MELTSQSENTKIYLCIPSFTSSCCPTKMQKPSHSPQWKLYPHFRNP